MPAEIDLTLAFAPLMTGLQLVVLLIALGVAAYIWASHFIDAPLRKALYPRRFVCPVNDQRVEAKFVAWKGQPWHVLDVERCSGWRLGSEKTCNKECMRLFDGPAPAGPILFL
jgi:hypothetical protein